jgi:hypothetical protein
MTGLETSRSIMGGELYRYGASLAFQYLTEQKNQWFHPSDAPDEFIYA